MVLSFIGLFWLFVQGILPPAPFFTFTAQGMLIMFSIIGIGLAVIRFLRKFDRNFQVWLWEHEVMWQHHRITHEIPAYPNLFLERRAKTIQRSAIFEAATKKRKQEQEREIQLGEDDNK